MPHSCSTHSSLGISSQTEAKGKGNSKSRNRAQSHLVHAQGTGSVTLIGGSRRVGCGRVAFLGGIVDRLVLDANVFHLGGAVGRSLRILLEADVGAVIQGASTGTTGHNLDGSHGAIRNLGGECQLLNAELALAGGVEELGSQGDVEVGRVLADAEVDVDVGPGVVEGELDGAAIEGPVGHVAGTVINTSAYKQVRIKK